MKKIVFVIYCITQLSFSNPCGGESGSTWINDRNRNSRPGGFVADGAVVEEYVFIAPTAAVCGSATITGNAKINGNARVLDRAIVQGGQVSGNAIVKDDATIENGAIITADAIIGGDAVVSSGAIVRGFTERYGGLVSKGVYSEPESEARIQNRITKQQEAENAARLRAEQEREAARLREIEDERRRELKVEEMDFKKRCLKARKNNQSWFDHGVDAYNTRPYAPKSRSDGTRCRDIGIDILVTED